MEALTGSFVLYTVGIAIVGLLSTRFSRGTQSDFLLADRGLGAWVAGLSSAASAESGWVTLGLVGFAFTHGIAAFWVVPGTVLAFVFNWFVLGPRLQKLTAETGALTIPDLLACRSTGWPARVIRLSSVAVMLTMLTAYAAAQFNAAGKMFSASFDWSYSAGVLTGAALVLLYTITGGFRAIAWTDVAQASLMIAAVVLIPGILIVKLGGIGSTWAALESMEDGKALTDWIGMREGVALISFLTLWFGIPLGNPGQPHVMIRLMAVSDRTALIRGGVISSVWVFLLFTGAVTLGLCGRVWYGSLPDPEQTLPLLAKTPEIVSPLFGGMVLAAIFAAICSTADSQLLVAATAVSHDLPRAISPGPHRSFRPGRLRYERSAIMLTGIAAALLALSESRSVFDFVLAYGWAGLGAGFGPAMIMILLSDRTTGIGVAAGILTGFSVAMIWRAAFPELNAVVYNLIPAFAASLAVIWLVSGFGRARCGNSREASDDTR